jgi:lipid-binding SYLF domain-containing protein
MTYKFEELQEQPDKRVPPEILRRAQGIILLSGTRAGLFFAYQAGSGVALARDARTGSWSPVAFLRVNEPSLGFQVGGEQNFFVMVILDPDARRLLGDPGYAVGSEARGTAGDASAGVESQRSLHDQPVLVYSGHKGLFAGAAIEARGIRPDEDANWAYYGRFCTMKDILFDRKVAPTAAVSELAARLTEYSQIRTTDSR